VLDVSYVDMLDFCKGNLNVKTKQISMHNLIYLLINKFSQ